MKRTGSRHMVLALVMALLLLTLPLACGRPASEPAATRRPARTATPCDKCGKDRPRPTRTRSRGTSVGQEAPDFGLTDLEGRTVRLSDFRGRVVLLNFWASWCGPCRAELPGLIAAHQRYGDRGFTVLAVNLGEPPEHVKACAEHYGMPFPVLLDPAIATGRLYPSRGIPTSFLLDGEGVVRKVMVGSMDEEMIIGLIEPLLGT